MNDDTSNCSHLKVNPRLRTRCYSVYYISKPYSMNSRNKLTPWYMFARVFNTPLNYAIIMSACFVWKEFFCWTKLFYIKYQILRGDRKYQKCIWNRLEPLSTYLEPLSYVNDLMNSGLITEQTADLVAFTEEILNWKLHFLCRDCNHKDR